MIPIGIGVSKEEITMKIINVFANEEVKAVESLSNALVAKELLTEKQAAMLCSHENLHEAHAGFIVIGENTEDGYKVEITIPEWVTIETCEVIEKNLDQVVSVAAAVKAAALAFKVLVTGLKKDFKAMLEKHGIN